MLANALVGCQTTEVYFTKPYGGEPYVDSADRLDEYDRLKRLGLAPKTRAWIREADLVIRQNNSLLGVPDQDFPELPE